MKLKNKKTGEVFNFVIKAETDQTESHFKLRTGSGGWEDGLMYGSLEELNEEWEDYEEPKDIWWLDNEGRVNHSSGEVNDEFRKNRKIGNYFKTKEEAEKAVEKLKAWKRLKDKGFSTDGYTNDIGDNYYMPSDFVIKLNYNGDHRKSYPDDVFKDLDLLFGGEE